MQKTQEKNLIEEIRKKISDFTKTSPPPEMENKYLAVCSNLLKIQTALNYYEEAELNDIKLLLTYLDKVNHYVNFI